MNITFKKIPTTQIPDNVIQITDILKLVEIPSTDADGKVSLSLFFTTENNPETYLFEVIPDTKTGALSDVVNDILKNLFEKNIEGIDDNELGPIIRTVNIVAGDIAKNESFDPTDKIIYHMLNGMTIFSNMRAIDWEDLINNHLGDMVTTENNVRVLLRLLLTERVFTPPKTADNPEPKEVPVEEFVADEIRKFQENNKYDIDYSMFDNDIVPTRGVLIAKVVDMLEIYHEFIAVANMMRVQRDILRAMHPEIPENEKTSTEKEIPTTEAEVVSEG